MINLSCKKQIDDLAVFGGEPMFDDVRPIGQLAVPAFERYWPELRKIVARGSFEDGKNVEALEESLAQFHDVEHCITLTNACVGLIFVLRALCREERGNVVVPAFTYVGIPHLVKWAGQTPRYCDVEPIRHALDPGEVRQAIDDSTLAILAVCTVTGTCSIDELSALAEDEGVPLVFDSVSALGATYGGKRLGGFGRAEVFSLHATKLLAGFEGGYVTTNDANIAAAVRRFRDDDRAAARLGEVHAAMARLSLGGLPETISRNKERYEAYRAALSGIPNIRLAPYVDEGRETYTYQMAFAELDDEWPLTRSQTIELLRAEGAGAMSYYDPPLHRSPYAPSGIFSDGMPVAEFLSKRFFYLPVGERTSVEDIVRIGGFLRFIYDRSEAIRSRLERGDRR